MDYVEIEVKAKTVDLAVEAAMQELGVEDREELEVEVITEPVKGFLGMGGQDAVVRVKKRPGRKRRNRRRKTDKPVQGKNEQNRQQDRSQSDKNGGRNQSQRGARPKSGNGNRSRTESRVSDERPSLTIEEQADVTREFLEGLVQAYGLEGSVSTRIDDDVIIVDVEGDQTEAMVGIRGSVRSAIHELTRTVLQRYTQDTARIRLDIAGYAERRRKALSIYAEQLIEQLVEEGGEIMLEPMSPADRKVIHDVAGEHQGVTSYSEGEPPRRFVVLSRQDNSEEE
ncbi:MAG TPA: RNA-binding cell elongation regulator Jag/EloR [Acidimicrobiia bacterium]|nr:RNA-binding cell elongation regulator Jag/EloR [Acidimicrobiia bacterium]